MRSIVTESVAALPIDRFSSDNEINTQQINGYTFLKGEETGCAILERGSSFIDCKVEEVIDT